MTDTTQQFQKLKIATNLFVISAPSGAGKTTLVRELLEQDPNVTFSVSFTTRLPRTGEKDGEDYFFVSEEEFKQMVKDGHFLEHARVFDNYYGTSKGQVRKQLANGKNVILEIDWQGAEQIRNQWPACVTVFILPPSLSELERRLRARQTDSEGVIERRLADSKSDISHWDKFDFIIINDNLQTALQELRSVIDGTNQLNQRNNPKLRQEIEDKGFNFPQ